MGGKEDEEGDANLKIGKEEGDTLLLQQDVEAGY